MLDNKYLELLYFITVRLLSLVINKYGKEKFVGYENDYEILINTKDLFNNINHLYCHQENIKPDKEFFNLRSYYKFSQKIFLDITMKELEEQSKLKPVSMMTEEELSAEEGADRS